MAKRTSPGEKPFSPIDNSLLYEVQHPNLPPPSAAGEESHREGPKPPRDPLGPRNVLRLPERQKEPEPEPTAKAVREKRLLLTLSEEDDIERIVRELATEFKTPLKLSHVLRATVSLLLEARDELIKQSRTAAQSKTFKRPPNNEQAQIAVFEHNLSRIIQTALKNAKTLD